MAFWQSAAVGLQARAEAPEHAVTMDGGCSCSRAARSAAYPSRRRRGNCAPSTAPHSEATSSPCVSGSGSASGHRACPCTSVGHQASRIARIAGKRETITWATHRCGSNSSTFFAECASTRVSASVRYAIALVPCFSHSADNVRRSARASPAFSLPKKSSFAHSNATRQRTASATLLSGGIKARCRNRDRTRQQ